MDIQQVAKLMAAQDGPQYSTEYFNRVEAEYLVRVENVAITENRKFEKKLVFEFFVLDNGGTPGANSKGAETKIILGLASYEMERAKFFCDAIIGPFDGTRLSKLDQQTQVQILSEALEPSEDNHGKSALAGREVYIQTKLSNTASRIEQGKPEFVEYKFIAKADRQTEQIPF